jgi:hypothetical protein
MATVGTAPRRKSLTDRFIRRGMGLKIGLPACTAEQAATVFSASGMGATMLIKYLDRTGAGHDVATSSDD